MSAPRAYIEWINDHLGFNPRSQANSDALSDFVTADLLHTTSSLGNAIANNIIAARKNAEVRANFATRNIDLVFEDAKSPQVSVKISVENKTIMAAHTIIATASGNSVGSSGVSRSGIDGCNLLRQFPQPALLAL
jgi:hypothetical protein